MSGVRFVLEDGKHHIVDSSDAAFQRAAMGAVSDGEYSILVNMTLKIQTQWRLIPLNCCKVDNFPVLSIL